MVLIGCMSETPNNPYIHEAIEIVGNQQKLADAVGVRQQTISKLLRGTRQKVSAEIAAGIHNATNGKVPKWIIRPDLFDAPIEEHA